MGNYRSGGPGPKKGERRGGRAKGTPNRATVERLLEAERAVAITKKEGRKLAREVLEDFMHLFAEIAALYQPTSPSAPARKKNTDEAKFLTYARMAVDAASRLAEFQSAKLRAVSTVSDDMMPVGKAVGLLQAPKLTGKPVDALEAYRMLRDHDIIDIDMSSKS